MKLLFVITSFLFIALSTCANAKETEYLMFNEFLNKAQDNDVISVEVSEFSSIQGKYKEGNEEVEFHTYQEDPNNNSLLLNLLREHKVKIIQKMEERGFQPWHSFSGIIMFLLPIVNLIFVIKIYNKIKYISAN